MLYRPGICLHDVPAPAKINLFLHVVGRREDGYHLLQTAFQFLDLADTLHFDLRTDGRIVLQDATAGVKHDDNLVVRAARNLQAACGTTLGADIRLEKRIPMGGGLGGGSSDAASTLIALNRLWNAGLDRQALMRLGLVLGADVPVFLFGDNAFAEGVGEKLQALVLPPRVYLVLRPGVSIPTVEIFSAKDLTRDSERIIMAFFSEMTKTNEGNISEFGRNDLETVAFSRYPAVRQVAEWMSEEGFPVRMSGSGSCLFGEFHDLDKAVLAERKFAAKMRAVKFPGNGEAAPVETYVCRGLSEHPLKQWVV